ncbi:type II secretory pathway, prepilin signal peptidase PulO [Rubidibacter lacunae KORDI 51-2]|uniref:Prepilin leader peptidase/N-methyltransferase n=1 Tax=Rubidibacter lacunae KORDI 51-2 TaxID=582515 RepID=U5DLU1_9CHRO|nr:A24 family peptidase [Rubidibacter lacunae]ERN40675.1 type II secretory pathway, prepilin signal peptidase PulO [Rubidibacter lacunae KORDI 51-2]
MDTIAEIALITVAIIFGASVGSFLNVVAYRIPAGLSLLYPPSHCPACKHRLGPTENVPVIGWLRLQGRCRRCRTRISPRYPLVEAAGAALFLLAFARFGWSLEMASCAIFLSWLLALSLIDIDTMTLPNALTQFGVVVGLGFQVARGWLQDDGTSGAAIALTGGILGAVVSIWAFEILERVGTAALGQEAMGGGDAKLAAGIGAWLGWKMALLSGFLASAFGSVIGVSAIALGLLGRREPMPFGPFLALGAAVSVLWGEEIIATYWSWFSQAPK